MRIEEGTPKFRPEMIILQGEVPRPPRLSTHDRLVSANIPGKQS